MALLARGSGSDQLWFPCKSHRTSATLTRHNLQVDWAGSKIAYYDEDEGKLCEASLIVAVLPCIQLIYAEVFRSETLPCWISAHINCFKYFGMQEKFSKKLRNEKELHDNTNILMLVLND
ncbi:MAG: hypothetical protein PHR78_02785 [Eubacteriales bacterium]|nr:hypothetical protein [Eubacteriales bacterium]